MATFYNETESKTLAKVEQQNTLLTLLQSSVSHELLTPLKCITSFAQNLERDLKHSPKKKEAQLISLTAKLLQSQVKMNLDKSLLENGKFEPNLNDSPINRVIEDVILIMKDQAKLKTVKLKFYPLPSETMVRLDMQRTQQVMINLISNAVKFSPPHSTVQINIDLKINRPLKKFKTTISVFDQGIGMSEEDLDGLFQPFFRSSDQQSREMNAGGHGLGLSICQKIAEGLNGSINVKSTKGNGTIMSFTF